MMKTIGSIFLALAALSVAYATQDVTTAVHGAIQKIDSATKTIVVKTRDGTEHSLRFLDSTTVHGAKVSAEAGKDTWQGLKEGTDVVVHYTTRGTDDTALEIDKVGGDGLKATQGMVKNLDRGGKELVVKAGDGVESTFRLTNHAAQDSGKDIAKGTEKGARVTVYYSERRQESGPLFREGLNLGLMKIENAFEP